MHSALMQCNATHSIVMHQCDAFTLTLLYLVCISAEGRLIANYQIASNIEQQQSEGLKFISLQYYIELKLH